MGRKAGGYPGLVPLASWWASWTCAAASAPLTGRSCILGDHWVKHLSHYFPPAWCAGMAIPVSKRRATTWVVDRQPVFSRMREERFLTLFSLTLHL